MLRRDTNMQVTQHRDRCKVSIREQLVQVRGCLRNMLGAPQHHEAHMMHAGTVCANVRQ